MDRDLSAPRCMYITSQHIFRSVKTEINWIQKCRVAFIFSADSTQCFIGEFTKKNLVYSLQRVEDFNSLHYIEIINHLNQIFWIVCHKSFSWWSSIITSHSEFSEIYSWKWVYLYCYITRLWSRFKHVVTGWFREQTLALNLRIYYVLHSSLSNPGFETLVLVRRAWQI